MHPRISLTPHIGAATLEAQDRIGTELATQITKLLAWNLFSASILSVVGLSAMVKFFFVHYRSNRLNNLNQKWQDY